MTYYYTTSNGALLPQMPVGSSYPLQFGFILASTTSYIQALTKCSICAWYTAPNIGSTALNQ